MLIIIYFLQSVETMSKVKQPPGKQKVKQPVISVAQELHVDVDLRRLYEACNQIGDEIAPFMKRIKAELLRVKEGEQEGVPQVPLFISERISYDDARTLFSSILTVYPFLRVIQLHHCGLDDDSMLFLVEYIKSYRPTPDRNPFGIQVLEIPGSKITSRGAGYVGKLMSENSTIERLVVDFTYFGDEGAQALCEGLRWNGSLKYFSMQHCNITGTGMNVVASRVIKGSNVKYLSLRGNPLGEEGIVEIGRALAIGTQIEELDLADTSFGSSVEAIQVLGEGMEASTSLRMINLDLNSLAPTGPSTFLAVIQKNRRIYVMPISERTDPKIYGEILDVLALNKKEADRERKKKSKGK